MSEHLREPDKTKYEIYDAIKTCLSNCGNWDDLKLRLKEYGIAMRYKYCGSTNQKQGVLFSKNGFEFSGSKIDRQFSYSKLNRHFTQAQQQTQYRTTLAKGFHAAIGNYRSAYTDLFGNAGGSGNKRPIANDSINFGGNISAHCRYLPMIRLLIVCGSTPTQARRKLRRTYRPHYGVAQHRRRSNGRCSHGAKTQTTRPERE